MLGLMRSVVAAAVLAVLAALLLPLPGCGPSATDRALDRAETLMEEHPDSAYGIIMEIDSMARQRSPRAKVLEYEGRYMLDIYPIIPDAVHPDFADMDVDDFTLMKAYYLRGYDSYFRGDTESAVLNALHAEKAANEIEAPSSALWKGRIYQLLGMSYSDIYNFVKAGEYFGKAEGMFRKAGKQVNAIYNGLDMILCVSGSTTDTETLDSLAHLAEKMYKENEDCFSDRQLNNYWYFAYAGPSLKRGDRERIERCLEFWNSDSCMMSTDTQLLSMKAKAMSILGIYSNAAVLADSLLGTDMDPNSRVIAYEALANCRLSNSDTTGYMECKDCISRIKDGESGKIIGQSSLDVQNRFNEETARISMESERRAKERVLSLAVVCCLILLAAVFAFITVRKRNRRRMEGRIAELIAIREDLNRINEDLTSSRQEAEAAGKALDEARQDALQELQRNQMEFSAMFAEQISTLNRLCEDMVENPQEGKRHVNKNLRVISELAERLHNPCFIGIVEARVNMTRNGLIYRFREQCSCFLSSDEIDFFILTASGMKYRTVSTIQDSSPNSYSKKKYRIKEKLNKNHPENLAEFISYL